MTWLIFLSLFGSSISEGFSQQVIPSNPRFEKRETNSGSSAGASVAKPKAPAPVVVTYTAVSPQRVFTNREGNNILARLLAFSAPTQPGEGPVEIVRDGNILLLVEKSRKPVEYPLENLSEGDREYIGTIVEASKVQSTEEPESSESR